MNLQEIKSKIDEVKNSIYEINESVESDIFINNYEDELKDMFNEYLDDINPEVNINGNKYSTSYALKEIDPDAYKQDYLNFIDAHYTELEAFKELESELEDLKSELEDLESELEAFETE